MYLVFNYYHAWILGRAHTNVGVIYRYFFLKWLAFNNCLFGRNFSTVTSQRYQGNRNMVTIGLVPFSSLTVAKVGSPLGVRNEHVRSPVRSEYGS